MIFGLIFCLLCLIGPLTSNGANAPSGLLCDLLEYPEETVITNTSPRFGWIYNPSFRNDAQSAFRIIVASSDLQAAKGIGNVWDSGWISNGVSINVPYTGAPLAIGSSYFWRVQTADSSRQTSPFSAAQRFIIGSVTNEFAGRYTPKFVTALPVLVTNTAPGRWFIDFGQDAFGYATVHPELAVSSTNVEVRFGEMASNFSVIRPPQDSTVQYAETTVALNGRNGACAIRPPRVSYPPGAINPPEACGVVTPFRYLELIGYPGTLRKTDVVQLRLLSEFNTNAATFSSSSSALDQIWNLCRNSMQVLTFDGVYVDGERERKPYESDAYIHQLSSYAVDREFTLPRHSFEYLVRHQTWPTEWKFHLIFMAWADYLQTGDTNLLSHYYEDLQTSSFAWTTTNGALMPGFPNCPQKTNSDVVDWPRADRDGFVIGNGQNLNRTNSVNNAFYYRSLQLMANIAAVLGRVSDAESYSNRADKVYATYNTTFWNDAVHCYVDGVGFNHASAHANFFPLAFGLVPPSRKNAVLDYLHSRITANGGMPCSVYGAQYFLEALFASEDTDTALSLMTTNGPRGWLNMINLGSTLTTEAWNFADKPNMDWNHAWGAAPGNLISRFILGLRPVTPGYRYVLIQPRLGTMLTYAEGVVPSIRGPIGICVSNAPGNFQLRLNIPGNATATVMLPTTRVTKPIAWVDGQSRSGVFSNNWLIIDNIGAGEHAIRLGPNGALSSVAFSARQPGAGSGTNLAKPAVDSGERN